MQAGFEQVRLPHVGIFAYMKDKYLEPLRDFSEFSRMATGAVVLDQGVDQDRLYVVVEGVLQVILKDDTQEIVVGEIGPGDCVGEISIFEPGPTTAMVRVSQDALIWHLDVSGLQAYFEQYPVPGGQLIMGMTQLLSRRLRQANAAIVANRILLRYLHVRLGNLSGPVEGGDLELKNKDYKLRTDIKW